MENKITIDELIESLNKISKLALNAQKLLVKTVEMIESHDLNDKCFLKLTDDIKDLINGE